MSGKKQKAIRRLARTIRTLKPEVLHGMAARCAGFRFESRQVMLKDCRRRDIKILKRLSNDPTSEIPEALEAMTR